MALAADPPIGGVGLYVSRLFTLTRGLRRGGQRPAASRPCLPLVGIPLLIDDFICIKNSDVTIGKRDHAPGIARPLEAVRSTNSRETDKVLHPIALKQRSGRATIEQAFA